MSKGGGGGACECPRGGGGVFPFFGGRMTSRGQCPRGGVPVNVQEWGGGGVFQIDDVTRTMSRVVPPIQVQTPPPHLAGWLRAWVYV